MELHQLNVALNSLKVLRSNVSGVFESLGNGLRLEHGEDLKENKFIVELQDLLTTVNCNLRDVEQAVSNLTPPPGAFNLGNTTYLSHETTQERQALYGQLVNSYKWTDKIHDYSNMAMQLLSQNSLKRSYTNTNSAKRRRTQTSSHNVLPEQVDNLILSFDHLYKDWQVTASRPFTTNAIVQITLARVLKAVISLKGLMIEWIVVKGYNETLDLWTESRHKVFRKVTENAHAAMLHFFSPALPELAVKSFMTWFHSYCTLFSDPCKRCGNHLHNNLPATWRDLRTLEPLHEECKH